MAASIYNLLQHSTTVASRGLRTHKSPIQPVPCTKTMVFVFESQWQSVRVTVHEKSKPSRLLRGSLKGRWYRPFGRIVVVDAPIPSYRRRLTRISATTDCSSKKDCLCIQTPERGVIDCAGRIFNYGCCTRSFEAFEVSEFTNESVSSRANFN